VIVSDNLRQLHGLRLGDEIDIEAPYGVVRLPVVGAIVDYSDQQGAILIDRAVFTRYWHDDGASDFRVYVAQGTPVADVRDRILQRYSGQRQVFVLTNAELKSYILNVTNQWFGLTNVQIAIAVLVAILGIVNSLTVSITDRRRELGVLSAVGALRNQVRATIWLEAAAVATAGLVLGGVLGAVNLYYVLDIVRRDVAGMTLDYSFPVPTALGLIPLILFTAWLAALWPAENAVRGSLVEALQYE
jgi:putative ABC transport system permease protein